MNKNSSPQQIEDFLVTVRRRRWLKRLRIVFGWLFIFLVILSIITWFVIQSEQVQNWAVKEVTTSLTEKLGTPVHVDYIDIDFFDQLVLNGFYAEDDHGDTLIYSGQLKSSLTANLLTLIGRDLKINEIVLEDAIVNIRKKDGERNSNLQRLLNKLRGKPTKGNDKEAGKPFFLAIDHVNLYNVKFLLDDVPKGEAVEVFLPSGFVNIGDLDLQENRFEVKSVDLQEAIVTYIDKVPGEQAPPKEIKEETPSEEIDEEIEEDESKPLVVFIHDIGLTDTKFTLHNYRKAPEKTTPEDVLDWKHLKVNEIQIAIDSFKYSEGLFEGQVNGISAKESSGFILEKLAAKKVKVSDRKTELYGLDLITPNSTVGDSLVLKYRNFDSFKNFENKVLLQAYFDDSRVALEDIIVFAPGLSENTFFINNFKEDITIDGYVYGTVNSLKGKKVKMKLGENTSFNGDFSTKSIAVKNEEFLSLDFQSLDTDIQTLRQLIPGFKVPDNFDKLGNIRFTGNFNGFFNDFSAFGTLGTSLGTAEMDMGLDIKQGRAQAKYYGTLELNDFDLGTWTDNENLGKITFTSKLSESEGLTLETVNATGKATITEFSFKGHQYKDIKLDGELQKNYFNGKLAVAQKFVDLDFDGSIDFVDSIPKYDFKADVRNVDLQGLKLIDVGKKNYAFSGKVDIQGKGKNLSTIEGTAKASKLRILHQNVDEYFLDSVYVYSGLDVNNIRTLDVDTDILEADLKGQFDIQEVPEAVAQFLERNFPEISDRIGLKSKKRNIKPTNFTFDMQITDSRNFANLLTNGIDTIRNARANGYFDTSKEQLELNASIPFIQYNNLTFDELYLDVSSEESYAEIEAGVYKTFFKNQQFEPIDFEGIINRDTMQFSLNSTNFNSLLDDLNLNGEFFFRGNYFEVSFLPSDLVILANRWSIDENNYIRFGEGFVETKNFDLHSYEKRINVESVGERGLDINLENIRLSLIDEFWDFSKMDFDGNIDINASIDDVFKLEGIKAVAVADTLEINGDDWGVLRLDAEMKDKTNPVDVIFSINKGSEQLSGKGFVGPFVGGAKNKSNKDYLFDFAITNYPLSIAEYFIENGLSNTIGTFDAKVRLDGTFKGRPNLSGTLDTEGLALTIDYLNTRYSVEKGHADISNSIFDLSGNTLIDKSGNTAKIQGGITHDFLTNFQLNATITSDEFLFLDTDIDDNPLYYGTAYGSGLVRFTGTFKQTDILVDATTSRNSVLHIPVSYEQNASEVTFIKYIDRDALKKAEEEKEAKAINGVNVSLFMDVNPEAEVYIIFDERAGDKIHGRGEGSINLEVNRDGAIEMFGDYNIEEGEYLFTLLNIVNKPFSVKQGGTINWTGDPFNADIELEATYPGRTALSTLLLEYFDENTNPDLENLARKSTKVDLIMFLTGKLLKPEINFDINFPQVDNELRNFVESKLSTLRSNQNELNRQVFGLMVVGSFLPGGQDAISGRDIGFNTVTEMLSSQLSIYLTELLSEVFTDVGFISGIDFDINYRYTSETDGGENPNLQTGSELEVRLSNTLFNDRLSVNVGGNVDWGTSTLQGPSQGAFLAGDLILEYTLTRDKRFKVRFYQRTDQTFEGRRNKTGLGFSYRREFDSFNDFIKGMKRAVKGE